MTKRRQLRWLVFGRGVGVGRLDRVECGGPSVWQFAVGKLKGVLEMACGA